MPNEVRLKRLSEIVKQRASEVILFELKDPRLGFVTVTRVKLAPDLSSAIVFWSVLGTRGQKSKTEHALKDASPFIQREVARILTTRVTPRLTLKFDPSIEGALRVTSILDRLAKERGEDPPAAPAPSATDEE